MAFSVRRAQYFYATVRDEPGEAYRLLRGLADLGTNLLAFTAVPVGPAQTQITIFPEDVPKLESEASRAGLVIDGPYPAILVQGDDELGALSDIHVRLCDANVNVFASSGVSDGKGSYGYVLYVKSEDYERAVAALGV